MKKIIFIVASLAFIIFVSCNAPTEVKVISSNGVESSASFKDFFDFEIIVKDNDNYLSIIMDRNTGILYIVKWGGYQYGISPIYDSDGTVMTKEKWLAKRTGKRG